MSFFSNPFRKSSSSSQGNDGSSRIMPESVRNAENFAARALRESREAGNEIDDDYVRMSEYKGLPFFAETEREYESFEKISESPVSAYSLAVAQGIFRYATGGYFNKSMLKAEYLVELLEDRARNGERLSQLLLMKISTYTHLDMSEARERCNQIRARYREDFDASFDRREAEALYAKAMVEERFDSLERFDLLVEAGSKGMSDAFYEIAMHTLNNVVCTATGRFPDYDETILYWWLAAEADNGLFAPEAQYSLAQAYEKGDGDITSNLERAWYWYSKAAKGGCKSAQSIVEYRAEGRWPFPGFVEGKTKGVPQLSPERVRELWANREIIEPASDGRNA